MNRQRILIGQQGEDLISVRFPSDSITFPVVPFISLSNFSILINRQDLLVSRLASGKYIIYFSKRKAKEIIYLQICFS